MRAELDDFFCRVERRLAPLTCQAYERDVRACRAFLEGDGIQLWGEVRPLHLRRFLAAEAEHRPAPSSQSRTIAALKGFFRFLVENEAIERDPASMLRTPKKREALPDVLDQRELARLLRAVERADVWEREHAGKRERDRLLLALFAYAGLAAPSCSGSTGRTSTSSGASCTSAAPRAAGRACCRCTPRYCRSCSTTSPCEARLRRGRCSSAYRVGGCRRP